MTDYERNPYRGRVSGGTRPQVLILSSPDDVHADAAQEEIVKAGVDMFRCDIGSIGVDSNTKIAAQISCGEVRGSLSTDYGECDLGDVTCVWHRRPTDFSVPDPADLAELRFGVGGVVGALPHLNHPVAMAAAHKPLQLALALRCGLNVPDTLIRSDRMNSLRVGAAIGTHDVVVKPMARFAPGPVTREDRSGWKRPIHLTQRLIDPAFHVRVTAVDNAIFAVRIDSPSLDWRAVHEDNLYAVIKVPEDTGAAILRLLARLNLRFGALDFVVDTAGRWWFLEVNPNGQWLWLEAAVGVPISAAVAAALIRIP